MSGRIQIREAIVSERKQLEELQWRASLGNEGDRDALLAHPDAIHLPAQQIEQGKVFVSEFDGKITGFAAVEPRSDGESELDALFVEPGLQKKGFGRALVEYSAEFARQSGSTALYVVGNPHAEQFYKACGFETIQITATRFGPGLRMRKIL